MRRFIMLQEITTRDIMTARDAMKKYSKKYFIMITTEEIDRGYNDLGYVLFIADTSKELAQAPREKYKDLYYALMQGDDVEPFPSIENVVVYA